MTRIIFDTIMTILWWVVIPTLNLTLLGFIAVVLIENQRKHNEKSDWREVMSDYTEIFHNYITDIFHNNIFLNFSYSNNDHVDHYLVFI